MTHPGGAVLGGRRAWILLPLAGGLVVGLVVSREPVLVVAGIVALILAAIGALRPTLLIGLMFVSMLFDRLGLTGVRLADFPITASKLSVLATLGLWGVHCVLTRARPFRWHSVIGGMLGMVAVTALCTALANSLTVGKFSLFGLGMMTVLVALVYAVIAEAELRRLYGFIGVALLLTLIASVASAGGAGEAGRASGTFGDPNEWATTVLLLTPLVLGGLVDVEGWPARLLRMGLVLLAPLSVLLSASRAALAVGTLLLPPLLYLMWPRRRELGVAGAAALIGVPLVVDLEAATARIRLFFQNLGGGSSVVPDSSLAERTELLHQGWALFMDNWLVGSGPGTFARATGFLTVEGTYRPAHNTYLEIAAEQGVFGLAALVFFGFTVGATLWGGLRRARSPRSRQRVVGVTIGLAGVALMGATLGLLTFSMGYLVLGFALAVVHQARARG